MTGSHDVVLFALFVSLRSLTFVVYTRSPILPSFPPHVRYSSLDAPNKTYLIGSHRSFRRAEGKVCLVGTTVRPRHAIPLSY